MFICQPRNPMPKEYQFQGGTLNGKQYTLFTNSLRSFKALTHEKFMWVLNRATYEKFRTSQIAKILAKSHPNRILARYQIDHLQKTMASKVSQ